MHVCTDPVNENSLHEIKFDDNESLLTTAKYRHYIELYVSFGHFFAFCQQNSLCKMYRSLNTILIFIYLYKTNSLKEN